jgi:hypothetical protein
MRKLLLPILVFMLFFSGCGSELIQPSDIDSMTITALPSPPKVKTINKKVDIEKVVSYINSISKEKIELKEDVNGWVFLIKTKGKEEHSISFIDNMVHIDNDWYKIDTNETKKLRELYNKLQYEETPAI